jgi:pimeloyl-ACP methyl ester carboxylesterase
VDVPLDHADPDGTQIQLAVSRIRHSVPEDQYQGVMLVNPGGPGNSGLELATLGRWVPRHVGDAYDWIGFDPRGVGSSEPSLSCIPRYFHGDRPAYVPTTQELESRWLARSERFADACQEEAPDLLQHMSTIDTARDMDLLRQALGVDQINYYGFSYGTYLGQVYATLFPGKISPDQCRNQWVERCVRTWRSHCGSRQSLGLARNTPGVDEDPKRNGEERSDRVQRRGSRVTFRLLDLLQGDLVAERPR